MGDYWTITKNEYIGKINKSFVPNSFVFVDSESDSNYNFKLASTIFVDLGKNVEEIKVFNNLEKLHEYIDKIARNNKHMVYVIAHNWHFDFINCKFFEFLKQYNYEITKICVESDLFFVKCKNKHKKLVFLDSFNFFKNSVEEIGKSIGLEKLKINIFGANTDELKEYCIRDVQILKEFFVRFVKFIKDNNFAFGLTAASTSFKTFRKKFMKHKIQILETDLARKSYYGGRCEVWKLGKIQNVYVVDVNSLYPYVMQTNNFPTKLLFTVYNPSIFEIKNYIKKGYCVIAEVLIQTDEEIYPFRPEKKLIFPIGLFVTYLSTPELLKAINNGHIRKIYKAEIYESNKIFADFVKFFWNKRKNAKNKVEKDFYKLLMNSLYGKFGQKQKVLVKSNVRLNLKDGIYVFANRRIYVIGGQVFYYAEEDKRNVNVAIASHITAYARIYLWDLIEKIGKNNVYYMDTDSLFVNRKGLDKIKSLIGTEIGQLKLEHQNVTVVLRGPKDYEILNKNGEKIKEKIKGIPKNAQKIAQNAYKYLHFVKIKTFLKKQLTKPVEIVTKILKRKYDKRIVTVFGRTKPIKLKL